MSIKAITFDYWHTLLTEQPSAFKLYQGRRRSVLREALLAHQEFSDEQYFQACAFEAECHHRIWQEEHRTLRATERIGTILRQLELSLPDAVLTQVATQFEEGILEHPPVLVDGVRETLEQLRGRYRLGIISDVGFSPGRVLKEVLLRNGLLEFFDALIFSDEAGRSKPHVGVFELAAQRLGAKHEEIAHIGDLENTDIIGAKGAGFTAIRFTGVTAMNEDESTIADYIVDDLREITRLVETIA